MLEMNTEQIQRDIKYNKNYIDFDIFIVKTSGRI